MNTEEKNSSLQSEARLPGTLDVDEVGKPVESDVPPVGDTEGAGSAVSAGEESAKGDEISDES